MIKYSLKLLLAIQIIYLPMFTYSKPIADRVERQTKELFAQINYHPGQTTIGEMLKAVKPFISPKSYLRLFERTKKSHQYKVPEFTISNNVLTMKYNKNLAVNLEIRDQVTSFYKINNSISSSILDVFLIDPFVDQLNKSMKIKKPISYNQKYMPIQFLPYSLFFTGNLKAEAANKREPSNLNEANLMLELANEELDAASTSKDKKNAQLKVDAAKAAVAKFTKEATDNSKDEGVTMSNFPWMPVALVAAVAIGGYYLWKSANEVKNGLANINIATNSKVEPLTLNPIKADLNATATVGGTMTGALAGGLDNNLNLNIQGLENSALVDKIEGLVTKASDAVNTATSTSSNKFFPMLTFIQT